MTTDWSHDPALAAAQRRRERGPRIQAHADTNGRPPDPIVAVQREITDRGTRYSISDLQYVPSGRGTARRLSREEVLDVARRECRDWVETDLGCDLEARPELAARLEPRDLGRGRVGIVVDEVLAAELRRR